MKNYKFLMPIVLVALFALSIYKVIDGNVNAEKAYETAINEAREYAEDGIQIYAIESYEKALALKPSLSLYLEIGEYYKSIEKTDRAIDWGDTILKKYPREPDAYLFLMEIYQEAEDYIACYQLYDTFTKRNLHSSTIEDIISGMEYDYYYDGEYADVSVYSGGYCAVKTKELWGYVNEGGKSMIAAQYAVPGAFISGMAAVVDCEGEAYYIDEAGNKILNIENVENLEQLGGMENNVFSAYDGKYWGYYKKDGEKLLDGFDHASILGNGVAAAEKDGTWTIYDGEGQKLITANYDDVIMDEKGVVFRNERLFVRLGEDVLLIDSAGNQIGKNKYEDAQIFYDTTYAAVKQNGKWGFIDADGNWFIEPQYEEARSFSNGFAAIMRNGRWGFVNLDKEECISCEFEKVKDFNSSGCVFVYQYDVWSLLKLYRFNH